MNKGFGSLNNKKTKRQTRTHQYSLEFKKVSENLKMRFSDDLFKDYALQIKFSHDRRMVAGTFLRACVQIDINVFQHGRQGGADELVVDAQSEFALEHRAAIVKPSVKRAFGVDLAQAVGQA